MTFTNIADINNGLINPLIAVDTLPKSICTDRIQYNRNRRGALRYLMRSNKIVAVNCEYDTDRRVTHINKFGFKRDLTRYGIEPNPGPLSKILEDTPHIFIPYIYSYCTNCGDVQYLLEYDEEFMISTTDCKHCEYHPQSLLSEDSINDIDQRFSSIRKWLYNGNKFGSSFLSHYMNIPLSVDKHINLLEDIVILIHGFLLSRNIGDRYIAIVSFCKRRGSRIGLTSTLLYVASDLFAVETDDKLIKEVSKRLGYESQSEDNVFAEARQYLGCYDRLKETSIYKKLHKFSLYILTLGLLDGIKIDFESMNFSEFEAKCIKNTHKPGIDMVHCFLDTILFVCDKGMQYFKTGDSDVIFHSGSSYESWINKALKLQRDARFLNNPEPHGINKFTFLSDLKDCIEKGVAISKYSPNLDKHEKMYIRRTLSDLQLLESEQITRRTAQMPRKDPFAVLIHGSSSICKSQLKQILFYHYGKVFGLPTTPEYMYTRCPTDEYWSGFDSTQWCIVMDDIAFLKPSNEVDPTLKEMLQVKNSVPYTPPQASLEDKGRTPVRAELLIGTTNTKHLNLYAYFACPFAIARRMSYVITASVKKNYTKHRFMADSCKIPITPDGEYMNIWDFEVAIPVPQSDTEVDNQQTKYKVIHRFRDINDMLAWYISVAKEHEASQTKALNAESVMANIEVCQKCYRTSQKCCCVQYAAQSESLSDETIAHIISQRSYWFKFMFWIYSKIIIGVCNDDPDWFMDILAFCHLNDFLFYFTGIFLILISPCIVLPLMCLLLSIYFAYRYIWVLLHTCCSFSMGVMWKYKLLFRLTGNSEDTYRFIFAYAGERVKKLNFTNKNLIRLAKFISAPLLLLTCRKLWLNYIKGSKGSTSNVEAQGNVGTVPIPDGEKPVFYYHNPYVNTDVEISGASKCSQGDILDTQVRVATAKFIFKFPSMPGTFSASIGFNFYGNLWLLNKHVLKENIGSYSVIRDPTEQNVSRNIHNINFCNNDITMLPNTDLAIIQVRAIAPGVNLMKYFPLDNPLKGKYRGTYQLISKEGDRRQLEINNIFIGKCPFFGVLGYHGRTPQPTMVGDCGAICLAQVGESKVLLGSHTSGNSEGGIFFQHISQAMLKGVMSKFGPQVECGTAPISAPGYLRNIQPLHPKSTIRWLEKGTATVMGSFSGYRPKHKSRVKDTYVKDFMVNNGYKANCGPPDMSWRPWHLALKDMVAPSYTLNTEVLDKCVDSFYDDIVDSLGDKINDLKVYTLDVALNGADGVTFVDMLNTSTSAGNPFKKSKKHFIKLDGLGKIESVDPIIQERINDIEKCYSENKRFHPQFCAHLKDEPTPQKKIDAGKTRVFTGGEFAWSVVVRKYLLSAIRLIQNNPYAFEAMPGIVAQSKEWQTLFEYITKFGIEKIIAGDYGKFDKKMIAAFILAAFKILEKLCAKAGWSEEDLQYIRCIAYDTAFAHIDFNGDYIEIQGNPSGHPLTVIINCLVNSLYMRYAFYYISKKPLKHFRKYVNLATYGDDNIMGVSDECPEFTHTRISVILKLIGVDYTMADKEAESVPYIHIDEASFLKRKFQFDPDVNRVVAPLDHSSIDKMLTSRLDEGTLDPKAHSICVIETALREYFFYGKDKFEERRIFFKRAVDECGLGDWVEKSTFPTYEQLLEDFYNRLKDFPDHNIETWSGRRE